MAEKPTGERGTGRVRRRVFTFFSALSLLICVAVCVLWVRSGTVYDVIEWLRFDAREGHGDSFRHVGAGSARGLLIVAYGSFDRKIIGPGFRGELYRPKPPTWRVAARRDPPPPDVRRRGSPLFSLLGFQVKWMWRRPDRNPSLDCISTELAIVVPHWMALLLSGATPAFWFCQRVRQRRAVPGLCPSCGYDLRATPWRCPECGDEPTA
jgi:hypothetical protein